MTDPRRAAIDNLKRMIQVQFDGPEAPDEEVLRSQIDALVKVNKVLTEDDAAMVFEEIAAALNVKMHIGVVIDERQHKPWLAARDPEWELWKAYKEILAEEGRSPQMLASLDSVLNRILDHMGDPADESAWSRRGLVIGEVQSGKTSTYIGLIDKAIDVGYRVIVLLGGSTELLRRQTQERVDFGVIGRDTSSGRTLVGRDNLIGVGTKVESTAHIDSLTTQVSDFNKSTKHGIAMIAGPQKVVIFVTKKNKTVLNHIAKWFQEHPGAASQLPMLLIDDESDYASINTNDPDGDPTAINAAIRDILGYFNRSSYVAFTATPFANIFIDDKVEQDLFPKDLIYALDSPSNYHGCGYFFEAVDEEGAIRLVDDAVDYFPLGHKRSHDVSDLPESLSEAIRCFLLSNSIRDLRGQAGLPASMLINVSRFTDVQAQVFDLVRGEVATYKNAIDMHSRAYGRGEPNPFLSKLEATFQAEFADCGAEWDVVLDGLRQANFSLETLITNSRTGRRESMPLRYVAIGGDLLSRGLTLEGLSTSYFYRRTQAADTLMQMGRWFGYRSGYEDLCRIWLTEEMAHAFQHALASLDDLRVDIGEMARQQLTPRQFGISVRLHPDALAITARNKMKASQVQQGQQVVSLRGTVIETARLHGDVGVLGKNLEVTRGLIDQCSDLIEAPKARTGRVIYRGIDKELVGGFLRDFEVFPNWRNQLFEGSTLSDFVCRTAAEDLQLWDIAVMSGTGERSGPFDLPGLPGSWRPPTRAIGGSAEAGWTVSGTRMRVLGPGDAGATLSEERNAAAKLAFVALDESNEGRNVPDRFYTKQLERPALLLYPIQARPPKDGERRTAPKIPLVAVAVLVPGERSEKDGAHMTYVLNTPAQRLWIPELLDDFDDELEDGDDHDGG